ncbi:MAG: oxygen-insensitive NAD(P)H nitroreductase [Aeromonadaceae bacterium]|nr:oxygen-insensitive NAD(P)H nitroreductase [Aeromonadaceae bacterium]
MNITEIVRTRHTCKAYDQSRPLSEEQLQQLQEILRFSPSSVNSQPWHFFLISSDEGKAKLIPTLTEHNMEKVRNAPLTVVIATKTGLDDAHLQALLEQETLDGRFGGNEEARKGADGARRYYVGLNSTSPQKQQEWMARQAYISLGFLLMGAATLGLDATPIEGFFPEKLDAALGLGELGLKSVVLASIGYRSEQDFNASLNKSRLPAEQLITRL